MGEPIYEHTDQSVSAADSKNILIADDSQFFRTKLSDILVEAGHKVRFARDGKEVIEEIRIDSTSIDLLILDLQMPELDGFGVLKWMEENGLGGTLPVLVITSVYEPTEVLERLRELGAAGLVTKGFPPEQLIFRVNRALYPDKIAHGKRPKMRVAVSVPVDFSVDGVTKTGYILNLSENGVYIHTKERLRTGTDVFLKFSLPGGTRVYDIAGTVSRTSEEGEKKRIFEGIGVRLREIEPDDAAHLQRFVEEEVKKQGLDR